MINPATEECRVHTGHALTELGQLQSYPLNMADWYNTKGDGLCGYHAFVSSLSAARGTPAPSLLLLAIRTLQHPRVSTPLAAKMLLMLQHLLVSKPGMVVSACWCCC